MNETTDYVEIKGRDLGLYEMSIKYHLKNFPKPRPFSLDFWKDGGTVLLIRKLKSIYPRSLKVGETILTLDWKNHEKGIGPYTIQITN